MQFYGPVIRIGIEGKWVQFIRKRPTRKELLALIERIESDRQLGTL